MKRHRPRACWDQRRRSGQGLKLLKNLLFGGKTSLVVLGKNFLAVSGHVEYAAPATSDYGVDVEFLFDLSRQTGGSRVVISNDAVLDLDVHACSSLILTTTAVMLS